jgi:hypothetical protein
LRTTATPCTSAADWIAQEGHPAEGGHTSASFGHGLVTKPRKISGINPITNGTLDTINLRFTTATSTKVFTYQPTITFSHCPHHCQQWAWRAGGGHYEQSACAGRRPLRAIGVSAIGSHLSTMGVPASRRSLPQIGALRCLTHCRQ